ncbi:MAG: alpha/beta fold hydrolase [Candidatus Obscuribacterales bacterium]
MRLAVKKSGDTSSERPDVVLIHGTGSSADMWLDQVKALNNAGHQCFMPDLRGHGESGELYEKTCLDVHTADVAESLAESGLRYPAVFVGHSLGALISLNLATNQPELTRQLFLAALPARVFKVVPGLFRMFMDGPFHAMKDSYIHPRLPWRQRTLLSTDPHSLNEIVENFAGLDLLEREISASCPIHLAAGRFDPVAPCMYVEKVHRNLPGSTLKIFELGGHNFMDYYKQSFNSWILDNLVSGSHPDEAL